MIRRKVIKKRINIITEICTRTRTLRQDIRNENDRFEKQERNSSRNAKCRKQIGLKQVEELLKVLYLKEKTLWEEEILDKEQ